MAEAAALRRDGRLAEAEAVLRAALTNSPASARLNLQLGVTLARLGRFDEAGGYLARAVELDPRDAFAQMNLGNLYRRRGALGKALTCYRAAVELKPELTVAWSNMLRPMLDACDWPGAEHGLEVILARRERGETDWPRYIAPMDSILLPLPPGTCREIADFHASQLTAGAVPVLRAGPEAGGRRRIAYLSRDFRNHAVGQLARAALRLHDRSRFEVLAYSYGPDDGSEYRSEVAVVADRFIDVQEETPHKTAQRIAKDGVEILVDLGGYTSDHRLAVLAQRPAPLQVHYLGYPATLGAGLADYYISDRVASPAGQDAQFAEQLVRMPDCFMLSDPDQPMVAHPQPRSRLGIPQDAVVFCAFHQTAKINRDVMDAWCEILRAVPDSVLWLKFVHGEAPARLAAAAGERGVAPQRLLFAPDVTEKREHVARMAAADVFLDTFGRYNGHSTVNEALWAGVPVVTIAGQTFATRVAASLLAAAGIGELALPGESEYVASAIRLARVPQERAKLRRRLLEAQRTAPLFDNAATVRALERAYETMWSIYATGNAPRAITL